MRGTDSGTEKVAQKFRNRNSLASSAGSDTKKTKRNRNSLASSAGSGTVYPPKGGHKTVPLLFSDTRDVTEDGTAGLKHSPPVRPSSGDNWKIKIIDDFVSLIPPRTTAQQKGERVTQGGKIRHYERSGVSLARKQLTIALAALRPDAPYTTPVRTCIEWTRPWLASDSAKVRAAGKVPHPSRPDADNLAKLLLDVLTSLKFWHDDNLVTTLTVAKRRGGRPGIALRVEPDMSTTPALELAGYHGAVSRFCALMHLTPDVPSRQRLAAELDAFCRWMEQRQCEKDAGKQDTGWSF